MHYFTAIIKIMGLSEYKSSLKRNSLYGTNIKTQFSHIIYTGWSCSFLTSAAIMGVQVREMSELGWLIGWATRDMWEDPLYFLNTSFNVPVRAICHNSLNLLSHHSHHRLRNNHFMWAAYLLQRGALWVPGQRVGYGEATQRILDLADG
jgi:hypothetical protein